MVLIYVISTICLYNGPDFSHVYFMFPITTWGYFSEFGDVDFIKTRTLTILPVSEMELTNIKYIVYTSHTTRMSFPFPYLQ